MQPAWISEYEEYVGVETLYDQLGLGVRVLFLPQDYVGCRI